MVLVGCAGLDAATPRKLSASPTPTAKSNAIAPADAQIAAESATGSATGSAHPLILMRSVRMSLSAEANDDDKWYSQWFDLKTGLFANLEYPVRVTAKCKIHNAEDYLLGKPGAKTCKAGIEVTDHSPAASSSAGFWQVASGSFDAFKEAYSTSVTYPYTKLQLSALGSVFAIRHGNFGPDAYYAKISIDAADIAPAMSFADVSWAFQTTPGVRILDRNVDPAAYQRDQVPPTPTPAPTLAP